MKRGDDILVRLIGGVTVEGRVTSVIGNMLHCRCGQDKVELVLRISDRGITWAPAWREDEAAAFRVACAL